MNDWIKEKPKKERKESKREREAGKAEAGGWLSPVQPLVMSLG